jgi:hypothetical protein
MRAMVGCPTEEEPSGLVTGTLAPVKIEPVAAHLESCASIGFQGDLAAAFASTSEPAGLSAVALLAPGLIGGRRGRRLSLAIRAAAV